MANYYVKNGGENSNTGLSDAQAWATIGQVNKFTFKTGDNVFFKCGGTWSKQMLVVDWSGTANNRVVVGAYYDNGIIGVSGNKPVFDGGTHSTSVLPEEPSLGVYFGLIHIGYINYITVQNISIKDSRGCGIYFDHSNYGIVENCDVDWIRASGIIFNNNSSNSQVIGCTAHNVGIGTKYFSDKNWGFGIGGVNSSSNIIIRTCLVYECWTEGIGLYKIADNSIIENNVIYDAQKGGIYLDAVKGNIIRYNLVYGTTNSLFYRDGNFVGSGLGVTDELIIPPRSENNKFYGNMVANCAKGMGIGANNISFKNSVVANNTFVDNKTNISVYAHPSGTYENSIVKNNISWKISTDCTQYEGPNTHLGLAFSNNLWSSIPTAGGQGLNDPPYALPKLTKTSGWNNLVGGELIPEDFMLQPDSPAIDKGIPIDGITHDFFGTLIPQGSAPDIGAVEYTDVSDPCEDVDCPDICVGTNLYSQKCNPDTGKCVTDQLLESDSVYCKIPTDEDAVNKYLILGALGIAGYLMLMKNKK